MTAKSPSPKGGRPKLGKIGFHGTLTKDEKKVGSRKAAGLGLDLSTYLGQLIRKDNPKEFPSGSIGGVAE
jgi:hypothetical protein